MARRSLLLAFVCLVLAGLVPATSSAAVSTTHPRLLIRDSDLPRLRAWASPSNPLWTQGIRRLALSARQTMDRGAVPRRDAGGIAYEQYPTELYAELFAFMSLVDPDPAARADWGRRARTLLMHVIDKALPGRGGENTPFRSPYFATLDRSRYYGEAFGLTLDWAYPYFTAADKAKIRTVFLRWANEQYTAYPLDQLPRGTVPTINGPLNSPGLLTNRTAVRWAINNYYLGHARNLGLMALAIDPADDPGGQLRRHLSNVTGQWLYLFDRIMRTDAAGGLSPEGFEYGPEAMGRLAQLLYAMRTSGAADAAAGPQSRFETNPWWRESIPAFLSSLPSTPRRLRGDNAHLSPVYQPAWFGDGELYWAADPVSLFAPLGLDARERGDAATLAATRWIVRNIPPGGEKGLVERAGGSTDNFFAAILYFLLMDPGAAAPADPRTQIPTTWWAPGINRLLARTCWCADERLFTYMLSWSEIDHQRGDGNDFGFLRKGEWLTKVRVGYSNPMSDFHNTVTIENDRLRGYPRDDFRSIGARTGSQWGLVPSGDPTLLARARENGYTYVAGDATKLYNTNAERLRNVKHASRSIVWLEPDAIVVYDRAVTGKARRFKRFWLQFPTRPKVRGKQATVRTRGQSLYVKTLAPRRAALTSLRAGRKDAPATEEPMKYRLSVEARGRPKSARFLHVLQATDRKRRPSRAVAVRSSGTRFAGAVVGATAVLFPETVGRSAGAFTVRLPGGVTRVLVTGLAGGAQYTAQRSGSSLRVTPGGTLAASSAGVLDIRG
jgi:hypothetical protein